MSGFLWKQHTATSVLTCKRLNAAVCQCECLRACLYRVNVSHGEYVSLTGVRSERFFFLALPLTSIPELGEPFVTASQPCRFSPVSSVISVNSGLYLQDRSLSASGAQELWPVSSTSNNKLMTGRTWKAYI